MSQVSTGDVLNIFKKVYGNIHDLLPEDYLLQKHIPFSQKQKVGQTFSETVVLTAETGITFGGSAMDAFELNPAVAGTVKPAEVSPYISVLGSLLPWGVASRSAEGGEKSFVDGTKHLVKNNIKSHGKFQEIIRLHGQSSGLLGYVYYGTETLRNVAFTAGSATLNSVVFTNGVNTTTKQILLGRNFASGVWVGMEGVVLQQLDSSNNIVAEGKLVSVEPDYNYITVDFTPVAASSTTSHKLAYKGMSDNKEMIGIKKILTTAGSLFGINNTNYNLFKGRQHNIGGYRFTFERLNTIIAKMVNGGGLQGDVSVYVNPRTWGTLNADLAALRKFDSSYKPSEAEQGFEAIKYHVQTGTATINAHRFIMEDEALILHLEDWSRSGSAEISFNVPGINKDMIFPLENQAAMAFRSFTDQYIFCHTPAQSCYVYGINDEAAS